MKNKVIGDTKKLQDGKNAQYNASSIWFTTRKRPRKQKRGEDNELFVYPPSNNKKTKRRELIVEV